MKDVGRVDENEVDGLVRQVAQGLEAIAASDLVQESRGRAQFGGKGFHILDFFISFFASPNRARAMLN